MGCFLRVSRGRDVLPWLGAAVSITASSTLFRPFLLVTTATVEAVPVAVDVDVMDLATGMLVGGGCSDSSIPRPRCPSLLCTVTLPNDPWPGILSLKLVSNSSMVSTARLLSSFRLVVSDKTDFLADGSELPRLCSVLMTPALAVATGSWGWEKDF